MAKVTEAEFRFDISDVFINSEKVIKEIDDKIKEVEGKLQSLNNKLKILDRFIAQTQDALENTDKKNFKLRYQLQNTLMKQIELQQTVFDSVVKFEKIIQDYIKQKQDVQNNKVSNFARWKQATKQESHTDEEFLAIRDQFQEMIDQLKNNSGLNTAAKSNSNLEIALLKELEQQGYKL